MQNPSKSQSFTYQLFHISFYLIRRWLCFALSFFMLFVFVSPVLGQADSCDTIVYRAFNLASEACLNLGEGEACYGYNQAQVTLWDGEISNDFIEPSDRISLQDSYQISTSPLNLEDNKWGIVFIQMQANVENTLPGQNILFILFGDTTMSNRVVPENAAQASKSDEVIGQDYAPMQAFYFRTGIGAAQCVKVGNGLVVQSPDDMEIQFNINGIEIHIASTVVFTSTVLDDGTEVLVGTLVEGTMTLRYLSFTLTLEQPGLTFAVTLNENGEVDENSELIDISGNSVVESSIFTGCEMLKSNGLIDPDACDFTLNYDVRLPGEPIDLSQVAPDDPCTVASINVSNLRGGPGTNYPWNGQLNPGEIAYPTGFAIGDDGYRWLRLTDILWIRSDLVEEAGLCAELPEFEAPPPFEPPPDMASHPIYEVADTCAELQNVHVGETITFQMGVGRWETAAIGTSALAGHRGVILIDDTELPVYYEGFTWHTGAGEPPGYGNRVRADWIVTSGTHTVISYWTIHDHRVACTFTVAS